MDIISHHLCYLIFDWIYDRISGKITYLISSPAMGLNMLLPLCLVDEIGYIYHRIL